MKGEVVMSDIVAELGEAIIALAVPDPVKRSALAFTAFASANRERIKLKADLAESNHLLDESIKDVAELDTQVVELENRVQDLLDEVRLAESARDSMRVERDEVLTQKFGLEAQLREVRAKAPKFLLEVEIQGGWYRCFPAQADDDGAFADYSTAQAITEKLSAESVNRRYRIRQI